MLKIKNKIEFENNCWVGEVDPSLFNSSEEHRIKAVTDIASITKGRLGFQETFIPLSQRGEANNVKPSDWSRRQNLYNRLLKESAGKPSVPFEFVPVEEYICDSIFPSDNYPKFCTGHYDDPEYYRTNLRNKLINGNSENKFNTSEDVEDFKIIVGRVPMKVITHIRTHRAFSFLVESSRNKKYLNNVEFHYPSWFTSGVNEVLYNHDLQTLTHFRDLVSMKSLKGEEATMELSDRRLVYFAMAAWKQDRNAWDNLFTVRGNNSGTMGMTSVVVDNIKQIINK